MKKFSTIEYGTPVWTNWMERSIRKEMASVLCCYHQKECNTQSNSVGISYHKQCDRVWSFHRRPTSSTSARCKASQKRNREIKNSVHLTILLRLTVDKFSSPLFPYKVSLSSHSSRGSIFWTTLIASSKGLLFHFLSSSRLQTDPLFPLSPKRTELGA